MSLCPTPILHRALQDGWEAMLAGLAAYAQAQQATATAVKDKACAPLFHVIQGDLPKQVRKTHALSAL